MIKIGLTGGIGCGKTTVSHIFKKLDVPVFNSDLAAREASNDPYVQKQLQTLLGADIVTDGILDRDKLRSIIFKDKDILVKVNEIFTPFVKATFDDFCYRHKDTHQMVMLESAIIFELKLQKNFDYIIAVTASEETRIMRVRKRDKGTKGEIYDKINNQLPDKYKVEMSDYVIINEGNDLIDSSHILKMQAKTILDAIQKELIMKNLTELINGKLRKD